MLKNYFIIALRNLWRHKSLAVINIVGLALGLAFALIVGVYVWGELQVNKDIKDKDRTYIILSDWTPKEMGMDICVPPLVPKLLKTNYPDLVESFCRLGATSANISNGKNTFFENIMMADTNVFETFGLQLSHGNTKTALSEPYSVVLTHEAAIKYFGKTDVLNQTIVIEAQTEGRKTHRVTGVLAEMGRNTIKEFVGGGYKYDIFLPISKPQKYISGVESLESWFTVYSFITFVKQKEGITQIQLEKALNQLVADYAPKEFKDKLKFRAENISDFHFNKLDGILRKLLMSLAIVAVFVLLMAILNYVNFSIGNSVNRLKEVGLRKTFGGNTFQVSIQFLIESLVFTFICFVFCLLLFECLKPYAELTLESKLPSFNRFSLSLLAFSVVFAVLIGLLAGFYPAIVLARHRIIPSLKGYFFAEKYKISTRRALLALQITLSVTTLAIALMISKQMNYIFSKDTGYSKENIIYIKGFPSIFTEEGVNKTYIARDELAKVKGVDGVSLGLFTPTVEWGSNIKIKKTDESGSKEYTMSEGTVDENFCALFNIKLIEGKCFFNKGESFQPNDIIINESAAKILGIKSIENAKVKNWNGKPLCVKGIMKDFHFESLHKSIRPLALVHVKQIQAYYIFSVKLNNANPTETISKIKAQYELFFPDSPFEVTYAEDKYKELHKDDIKLQKAVNMAVLFSIVIVVIGVIGIVSIVIAKRKKEIGVRKVLGASAVSIVWLFIKDFIYILLFAIVLGVSLGYVFISQWLQNFAYRVDIVENIWLFVAAGLITGLTVVGTIALQTAKTALENPSKSIRNE